MALFSMTGKCRHSDRRSLILHRPHRPTGHTGAGGRDLILHRQSVEYYFSLILSRHSSGVIENAASAAFSDANGEQYGQGE